MNGAGGNPNYPGGHFPPMHGQFPPGQQPTENAAIESSVSPPRYAHGYAPQPAQWFPDERMLRQICSQGSGAYRIRMTVVNPPHAPDGQPYYPKGYPMQGHPDMYHPQYYQGAAYGYPMAPAAGGRYIQQGMNMQPVHGHHPGEQRFFYPVMTVDEASNPNLGAVTLMQAAKPSEQTSEPSRKKKNKRKRTNPDKPKPARYAWNFFFKERYQKLRKGGGSGLFDVQEAFTKIGEKLGNAWKALSPEERKPYADMAAEDKARYEREMKKYKLGLDFRETPKDEEKSADVKSEEAKTKDEKDNETEGEKIEKELSPEEKGPDVSEITADILVTDDDETFMVMMEATLKRLNKKFQGVPKINIHKAKNGEEAIKKVVEEQRKYACITVDKEMGPGKDGFETVKSIRDSGYEGVVLGVTGNQNCEKGFGEMGADTTLMKGSQTLFNQIYSFVVEKINTPEDKDKKVAKKDDVKKDDVKKEVPVNAIAKKEEKEAQADQIKAN